jgi:hypothetical protein
MLLRHFAEAQDRAQDVVEVVRDAAGQRAQRLQPLGLLQPRLERRRSASPASRAAGAAGHEWSAPPAAAHQQRANAGAPHFVVPGAQRVVLVARDGQR